MRFESLRFRGFGPFHDEVALDLAGLPGTVVAVTGDTGAGKSTTLELLAGAAYRSTPTRGALKELATDRDSFVEATVVNGARWTIRQTVDHQSGRGESLVLGEDGKPALASSKIRDFDAWAANHLLPQSVYFAALFGAQQDGGFLAMKPGDRKGVVLRVTGAERLEALAEDARERARTARGEVATLEARLDDERSRGADAATVEAALAISRESASMAETQLAEARGALDAAETATKATEQASRDYRAAQEKRADLRARIDTECRRIADLEERIRNNQVVIGDRERIEASVARAPELDQALVTLRQALSDAQQSEREELAAVKRHEYDLRSVRVRLDAAEQRLQATARRIHGWEEVESAEKRLPELKSAVDAASVETVAVRERLDAVRGEQLTGAEDRIEVLRAGLQEIEAGAEQPEQVATDTLVADNAAVAAAAEHPSRVLAEVKSWDAAQRAERDARESLAEAQRLADRAPDIRAATLELAGAQNDVDQLRREVAAAEHAVEDARKSVPTSEQQRLSAAERLRTAQTEREGLMPWLRKAEPLARAQARLEAYAPEIATARTALAALEAELDASPEVPPPSPPPELAPLRALAEAAERNARQAAAAVAVAEKSVETARAAAARLAALEVELAAAHSELSDWVRLADDLGRDGLQAMLVDAAGAEITELANDLLATAFGTRFAIKLETTRLSADAKKSIESFEVTVIDSEAGRECRAETLSGGERVIVGEAVSLALTMMACRRAGLEAPDLIRDETGAALDEDAAGRYVSMLRRAARMVGAAHVFFVSHTRATWSLADARLLVKDGSVRVDS